MSLGITWKNVATVNQIFPGGEETADYNCPTFANWAEFFSCYLEPFSPSSISLIIIHYNTIIHQVISLHVSFHLYDSLNSHLFLYLCVSVIFCQDISDDTFNSTIWLVLKISYFFYWHFLCGLFPISISTSFIQFLFSFFFFTLKAFLFS